MGFCSKAEHEESLGSVPSFGNMLVRSGVKLVKYYLDISKDEQKRCLKDRKINPLKHCKTGSIDDQAIKHWGEYSEARNEMLACSHSSTAPWTLVRADDKHLATISIIKDFFGHLHYTHKDKRLIEVDANIVFPYDISNLQNG